MLEKITCLRCGHAWYPRRFDEQGEPEIPKQCPSCHSGAWDRPSSRGSKETENVAKERAE